MDHSLWVLKGLIFYIVYLAYNHIALCDSSLVILSYFLNLVLFNFHMLTSCLSIRIINNLNAATF